MNLFSLMLLFASFVKSQIVNTTCGIPFCVYCPEYYNDKYECSLCLPQYILIEAECIYFKNLYSNCVEIDTSGKCIACHYGYHLVGDNCLILISIGNSSGCISYKNDTCVSCPPGTRLDNSNNCIPCEKGCNECSEDNNCYSCHSSYYLLNGRCEKYTPHCSKYVLDKPLCESCDIGFTLNPSTHQCDVIVIQNCLIQNDFGECEVCYGNLIPSQDGHRCLHGTLIEGCSIYSSEMSCRVCSSGYFLNETKGCSKCPDNCKKCNSNGKCSECDSGYYVSPNKTCLICSKEETTICNSTTSLQACNTCNNYCMFDDSSNTCRESHCVNYFNGTEFCSECEENYIFESNGKFCFKPESSCKSFQSSETGIIQCVECHNGYYLTDNYECKQCDKQCKTCISSSEQCLECSLLNANLENNCVECKISNCFQCRVNPNECEECYEGYQLVDGECVDCTLTDDIGNCLLCLAKSSSLLYQLPNEEGNCYFYYPNSGIFISITLVAIFSLFLVL
ncbi:CXXC-rich, putative [Entamoeba histolytica HM-1:IMSS-B]|uniref:CXXC-rich protein n=4 Tax=Entamoeba histolytica TaxID=5759 RepID=C4M664_ENTH1|nr:CXXC-rich protein [Entamoeba histolytica HM-1:IMSS]EAL47256.2 CXXC-rich protein [Entamoeba histolytica HM-1:IMSS]EMD47380.1 CXXC-rich protein, putative [Entamoeba histolytica KU27]EMH72537.1 CXXC-rich, putative [Entamoeba histolytica HM-1:IMSS-B]ENY61043.1 CXXC-rich protein, putative [Entamoeba histolytica HM-1:IMSS-A]|eukprot:XP_652641.2 CXXC-rich protein [Entamoeba histolytica HM-1:IMSS]